MKEKKKPERTFAAAASQIKRMEKPKKGGFIRPGAARGRRRMKKRDLLVMIMGNVQTKKELRLLLHLVEIKF